VTDVARPQFHHVALTVTDVEASVSWYEAVFDIRFRMDMPHEGGLGTVLGDEGRELMIALHRHDGHEDETLLALAADTIVNQLPATNHHSRTQHWTEEFFNGFFEGPRQHRHRLIGVQDGKADLSATDVEMLLRAAVDALIVSDAGTRTRTFRDVRELNGEEQP
jgi:catechol 2,3-dioxygenase-like lactoylglutathione lyase family enzyme